MNEVLERLLHTDEVDKHFIHNITDETANIFLESAAKNDKRKTIPSKNLTNGSTMTVKMLEKYTTCRKR